MAVSKKDRIRAKRRKMRVSGKIIKRTSSLPRLSVFRSLKQISAQIIDDVNHKTLASFSSLKLEKREGDKKTIANEVGKTLAKRAQELGITAVAFDKGRFAYHGRVKALADGLREGGLKL